MYNRLDTQTVMTLNDSLLIWDLQLEKERLSFHQQKASFKVPPPLYSFTWQSVSGYAEDAWTHRTSFGQGWRAEFMRATYARHVSGLPSSWCREWPRDSNSMGTWKGQLPEGPRRGRGVEMTLTGVCHCPWQIISRRSTWGRLATETRDDQ